MKEVVFQWLLFVVNQNGVHLDGYIVFLVLLHCFDQLYSVVGDQIDSSPCWALSQTLFSQESYKNALTLSHDSPIHLFDGNFIVIDQINFRLIHDQEHQSQDEDDKFNINKQTTQHTIHNNNKPHPSFNKLFIQKLFFHSSHHPNAIYNSFQYKHKKANK